MTRRNKNKPPGAGASNRPPVQPWIQTQQVYQQQPYSQLLPFQQQQQQPAYLQQSYLPQQLPMVQQLPWIQQQPQLQLQQLQQPQMQQLQLAQLHQLLQLQQPQLQQLQQPLLQQLQPSQLHQLQLQQLQLQQLQLQQLQQLQQPQIQQLLQLQQPQMQQLQQPQIQQLLQLQQPQMQQLQQFQLQQLLQPQSLHPLLQQPEGPQPLNVEQTQKKAPQPIPPKLKQLEELNLHVQQQTQPLQPQPEKQTHLEELKLQQTGQQQPPDVEQPQKTVTQQQALSLRQSDVQLDSKQQPERSLLSKSPIEIKWDDLETELDLGDSEERTEDTAQFASDRHVSKSNGMIKGYTIAQVHNEQNLDDMDDIQLISDDDEASSGDDRSLDAPLYDPDKNKPRDVIPVLKKTIKPTEKITEKDSGDEKPNPFTSGSDSEEQVKKKPVSKLQLKSKPKRVAVICDDDEINVDDNGLDDVPSCKLKLGDSSHCGIYLPGKNKPSDVIPTTKTVSKQTEKKKTVKGVQKKTLDKLRVEAEKAAKEEETEDVTSPPKRRRLRTRADAKGKEEQVAEKVCKTLAQGYRRCSKRHIDAEVEALKKAGVILPNNFKPMPPLFCPEGEELANDFDSDSDSDSDCV